MDTEQTELRRTITTLPLALYGIGVTVGAGIYVLVGEVAAVAGGAAALSFVAAAIVLAPTAFSFAELSARFPRSAGEAVYVSEAFGSVNLTRAIGFLVAGSGVVSSAAVALGAAGYLDHFVDFDRTLIACVLVVLLGGVAAWGIVQSMAVAIVISLFEIGALVWIVIVGLPAISDPLGEIAALWPSGGAAQWFGVGSGLLLAFFAFVGFEDIVNMAEESKDPQRTVPRAIAITLVATTVLYLAVVFVSVGVVSPQRLSETDAPLAFVYSHATGRDPAVISAIAVGSTLNTVLIQMIMASRVLYGLAREGALPPRIGAVSSATRTPLVATAIVVAIIVVLAALLPIGELARVTTAIVLTVFTAVNLALIRIKLRGTRSPGFSVPIAVPACGLVLSVMVFAVEVVRLLS